MIGNDSSFLTNDFIVTDHYRHVASSTFLQTELFFFYNGALVCNSDICLFFSNIIELSFHPNSAKEEKYFFFFPSIITEYEEENQINLGILTVS